MIEFFICLDPVIQAVLATVFTWAVTALGACVVFLFKNISKNIMDATLGAAAGVMIAASFWSLLAPAIEMSASLGQNPWLTVLFGFLSGGVLLFFGDKFFEKRMDREFSNSKKRVSMLIFSITLHNIPEGMAVGVAFGSLAYGIEGATLGGAVMLAVGIGLQNFPEGSAVSLPLLREGYSPKKAFFFGQISGIVEPLAGLLGAVLVLKMRFLLPFLLAFAAGAMIYVVVEELIPESQTNRRKDLMALFTLIGFSVMMVMDVALG
ncbi:MAG: ZIP family metal transporter [Clostridia bacterium]|nr:ZIP family metal transporter [Clostridia bacterium]